MVTRSQQMLLFALGTILIPASLAQVVPVSPTPQLGSSNPVAAEPPIKRPVSTPCTVTLFTNLEFADYNNKPFGFTPAAACPGPWSKVVFNGDFTVTEGRQYDRSAKFYLAGVNIYFGTTAEPRAALSPSWHVERDVTDLSALFTSPHQGFASLGNFVGVYNGVTYNGIIYGSATLQFYPKVPGELQLPVADVVLPLSGGGDQMLNSSTDKLSRTYVFPRNTVRAYLDVIAQSQSTDEFWYLNAPSDVASELFTYGNTAFRETEIAIDGKPAGVAPIFPWIYTGGLDPFLWEPLPGVETLSFKPYRVDLSPFAGILSDGSKHTVQVSVFNANGGFDVTGALLLYTDSGLSQVTGGLTQDTLAGTPSPVVTENLHTGADGTIRGTIGVASSRNYTIAGYVNTSAGEIDSTIEGTVSFSNSQIVRVNPNTAEYDDQYVTQSTAVHEQTTTSNGGVSVVEARDVSYPFNINYGFTLANDGSYVQTVSSEQKKIVTDVLPLPDYTVTLDALNERVTSADTLSVDAAGNYSISNTHSSTSYAENQLGLGCQSRILTSAGLKLTGEADGVNCP